MTILSRDSSSVIGVATVEEVRCQRPRRQFPCESGQPDRRRATIPHLFECTTLATCHASGRCSATRPACRRFLPAKADGWSARAGRCPIPACRRLVPSIRKARVHQRANGKAATRQSHRWSSDRWLRELATLSYGSSECTLRTEKACISRARICGNRALALPPHESIRPRGLHRRATMIRSNEG